MRICDLNEADIKLGIVVRSLSRSRNGTIVKKEDKGGDTVWWIQWDGEDEPTSGFYWNDCKCAVVHIPAE